VEEISFGWQGKFKGHLKGVGSYWRLLHHKIYGFDTPSLAWQDQKNDINVLHRSSLFSRLTECNAPQVSYVRNGNPYDKGYYLADGIYPSWGMFVKTVRKPTDEKSERTVKEKEAARKNVEQAFGVLQSRSAIVWYPARTWSSDGMWNVMPACVIMHNMVVEAERDDNIYDQG
jgi:hypothetical protein